MPTYRWGAFFYKGASLWATWWCGDTARIFWIPILFTKITFCVSGSTEQWGTRPRGSQRNSWKRRTNWREIVHFVQISQPAGEKLPKIPKFPNKLERKCPKCPTFQTSWREIAQNAQISKPAGEKMPKMTKMPNFPNQLRKIAQNAQISKPAGEKMPKWPKWPKCPIFPTDCREIVWFF